MLKKSSLFSVLIGLFCTFYSNPGFTSPCTDLFQKSTLPVLSSQSITFEGFLKFQEELETEDSTHSDYRGSDYLLRLYLSQFSSRERMALNELLSSLSKGEAAYNPFFKLLTESFLSRFDLNFLSEEEAREVLEFTLSENSPQKITQIYLEEIHSLLTTLEQLSNTQNTLQLKFFLNSKGITLSDLSEFKRIIAPISSEQLSLLAFWLSHHYSLQVFKEVFSPSQTGTSLVQNLNALSELEIHFRNENGELLVPRREALKQLILEKAKISTAIEREFYQRYLKELLDLIEANSISTDELFGKNSRGSPNSKITIAHSHKTGENLFMITLKKEIQKESQIKNKIIFFAPRNDSLIRKQKKRRRWTWRWLTYQDKVFYDGNFLKPNLTESTFFGRIEDRNHPSFTTYDVIPWDFTDMYGEKFDLSDGSLMTLESFKYKRHDYLEVQIENNPKPETQALVPISTSTSRLSPSGNQ